MSYKKYGVIVGLTFAIAFCTTYLASANDIFTADWSTVQRCIAAGIAAVMAWFVAYASSLKTQLEDVKTTNKALVRAVYDKLGTKIDQ